ncbi:MAG: succinate dehydrogenase/fumarate reductase iron-sulfur subunit [Acidobacteria bacterium]|nr:succinate dehydrogenase/fumarate reductase iron-sulfur subunit [Acidobacteriota bacterium]
MNLKLKIWRQKDAKSPGGFVDYQLDDVQPEMSFLEMLDILNQKLILKDEDPVAFDHDCREGICGMCSLVINGIPHGPDRATTTCQLYMRRFEDGASITIEPFRASALPLVRDLVVDRGALDRIQQAGGFVSVNTGGTPDGNLIPIPKPAADHAMDAAACIGCAACIAVCKNASASLFTAAKISHLASLPQGQPERYQRAKAMVIQMDKEGFGSCTNTYDCEAVCPEQISVNHITLMNRDYVKALLSGE